MIKQVKTKSYARRLFSHNFISKFIKVPIHDQNINAVHKIWEVLNHKLGVDSQIFADEERDGDRGWEEHSSKLVVLAPFPGERLVHLEFRLVNPSVRYLSALPPLVSLEHVLSAPD
jgi:hypothetical protein